MGKRAFVCLLLGMFALLPLFPVADELYIATVVSDIGLMKITSSAVPQNTLTSFYNTPGFSSFAIHGSGTFSNIAYVSTLSNKPAGYSLFMSATPMTNGSGTSATYINYTVRCNSIDYTTNGVTVIPAVQILDVTSLTVITALSLPITIIVLPSSFNAAASGFYLGTVSFTFSAH